MRESARQSEREREGESVRMKKGKEQLENAPLLIFSLYISAHTDTAWAQCWVFIILLNISVRCISPKKLQSSFLKIGIKNTSLKWNDICSIFFVGTTENFFSNIFSTPLCWENFSKLYGECDWSLVTLSQKSCHSQNRIRIAADALCFSRR